MSVNVRQAVAFFRYLTCGQLDLVMMNGKPYVCSQMDYRILITMQPDKMGGKPCVRGLRITVYDVLDYLAFDMSEADILPDFPDSSHDDVRACLGFAGDRERRLFPVPA